jgi:hypothetical protein
MTINCSLRCRGVYENAHFVRNTLRPSRTDCRSGMESPFRLRILEKLEESLIGFLVLEER